MLLLALLAAFLLGIAAVYWILTPLQRAVWRRADRLAEQRRRADEDRRLIGDLRRICEPTR